MGSTMGGDRAPSTSELARLVAVIGSRGPAVDDAERIDRIRLLEELKAAACAAQVLEVAAFDASQRAAQAAAGIPAARRGRGVAAQIAVAMRTSHQAGQRFVGFARVVPDQLPATFAELRAGRISEWKAIIVARETAVLSRADQALVDHDLAPLLSGWGAGQIDAQARRAAYRLDPYAATARAARAREQRRVTQRPIPDTMVRLAADLPVEQAVACWASLRSHADALIGTGDRRTRGQLMADTLVERLTGQSTAAAVPIEVHLLMSDTTLLAPSGTAGRDQPALIPGHDWLPAPLARELALAAVATSAAPAAAVRTRGGGRAGPPPAERVSAGPGDRWLRRLFRHPDTGQLAAMDSRRRTFTRNQRQFLVDRDQTCRSPYCGAPIRHADHVLPWDDSGDTNTANGQGYCQACNHAKQAPGWTTTAHSDGTVTTHTPTGHTYASRLPEPPGPAPSGPDPEPPPEDRTGDLIVIGGHRTDVNDLLVHEFTAA